MLRCPRWPRSKSSFTAVRFSAISPHVQRSDALTLLHKTIALIPRALPAKPKVKYPAESLDFWNAVLSTQYQHLNSIDQRPARIAVYAVDQWSNSEDLVTALLEDPLTGDPSSSERLKDRWKDKPSLLKLAIRPQNLPTDNSESFPSTSSYLQQFEVPVEIIEIRNPPSRHKYIPCIDEQVTRALLDADATVILCNPLTTPPPSLLKYSFFKNPKTILVFTCNPSPEVADLVRLEFQHSCKDPHSDGPYRGPYIVFADPLSAVSANSILKSDPKSALAIQRYQDNFVNSRISDINERLRERLSGTPDSIRTHSSLATVHAALSATLHSLRQSRNEVETVFSDVGELNDKVEEARAKIQAEVFRPLADGKNAVHEAFQSATKNMKPVLQRMTWWRLPWTVDDTSAKVATALNYIFCPDLEKMLILHAGRLSVLQADLTCSTLRLLSKYNDTPFHSAVLRNTLDQLASSPSYLISPSTLTQPIYTRRAQVIQYPTTQLHVAGQRVLLGMAGSTITGAGISWAGWVGWLVGNGDGLLGAVGLDAGMSMGVGALVALGGIRWGVGKWEKAKRRWFEDWNRVGDGLKRDLEASLDHAMQNNVCIIAETGCKYLLEAARKHKQEIALVKDDADMLLDALQEADKH